MDLAVEVIAIASDFPWRQRVLVDQMQSASISVPSNIAEGKGRLTDRDFRRCLGIARGWLFELETQLEIASRSGLIDTGHVQRLESRIRQISAGITRLIRQIE